MLPLMLSALLACRDADKTPRPTLPDVPLVELRRNYPGTPRGYQADEIRQWGSATIGIAETIAYSEISEAHISIQNGRDLRRQTGLDTLGSSIFFLPSDTEIDERVRALRATAKGPGRHEKIAIVFTEIVAERSPEFRTYAFRLPGVVVTGTANSLRLSGKPDEPINDDGSWPSLIPIQFEADDFTMTRSELCSGELSRMRFPTSVPIPPELLPKSAPAS